MKRIRQSKIKRKKRNLEKQKCMYRMDKLEIMCHTYMDVHKYMYAKKKVKKE